MKSDFKTYLMESAFDNLMKTEGYRFNGDGSFLSTAERLAAPVSNPYSGGFRSPPPDHYIPPKPNYTLHDIPHTPEAAEQAKSLGMRPWVGENNISRSLSDGKLHICWQDPQRRETDEIAKTVKGARPTNDPKIANLDDPRHKHPLSKSQVIAVTGGDAWMGDDLTLKSADRINKFTEQKKLESQKTPS